MPKSASAFLFSALPSRTVSLSEWLRVFKLNSFLIWAACQTSCDVIFPFPVLSLCVSVSPSQSLCLAVSRSLFLSVLTVPLGCAPVCALDPLLVCALTRSPAPTPPTGLMMSPDKRTGYFTLLVQSKTTLGNISLWLEEVFDKVPCLQGHASKI